MNCSRCQTELPDTATYCTTCGASTRTSVPSTFSYLPPGTPPWPSEVPQGFSYKTNTALPAAALSHAAKAEKKANVSTRGIFITASLLVLAVLLGAGVTLATLYTNGKLNPSTNVQRVTVPTPVPTAAANAGTPSTANGTPATNQLPTPASFQKSNNASSLGVALKYPVNWIEDAIQTSTTSNFLRLHPQQSTIHILFVIERFSANTSSTFNSADELNTGLLQSLSSAQSVHNLQPVQQGVQQRSIAGVNWAEQDATYTDDGGNQIRLTTISVQHNKLYYNILIISPDIYYNEAMQKYIQPMFNSIQFLS